MLPHVDRFLSAHNLDSLHDLAAVLASPGDERRALQRPGMLLAKDSSMPAGATP
jgi:hypothetical protein